MSPVLVLLVTRPGALQDGMRALLTATRKVSSIVLAHDYSGAVQTVKELCPAMVIIEDGLLKDEIHTFLRIIQSISPQSKRIVVTDTVTRMKAFNRMDADFVFPQGTPAKEVGRTIERLLPPASLDDLA